MSLSPFFFEKKKIIHAQPGVTNALKIHSYLKTFITLHSSFSISWFLIMCFLAALHCIKRHTFNYKINEQDGERERDREREREREREKERERERERERGRGRER